MATTDYKSFHLVQGVGSADYVEIHPTYGFIEETVQNKSQNRTMGGQLNSYKLGGEGFRFTIPLTFVNSSIRYDVTDWWRNDFKIAITLNLSSNPESVICGIQNTREPLGARSQMQNNLFDGIVFLKSKRSSTSGRLKKIPGAMFILNHPVYSILDGSNHLW